MNEELLIKYLLKETSAEEDVEVKNWLDKSDANEQEFNRFKLIWENSNALSLQNRQDVNQAWERFKVRRDLPKGAVVMPIRKSYPWLKIAVAMLVVLTATWFYLGQQDKEVILASGNEVSKEVLPDGSELTLNKHSVISYTAFGKNNRRLKLEKGEVFFKVNPVKNSPFIIQANEVKIEVLGTSFNVKHSGKQTEVIVETGLVSVSKEGMQVKLAAGEKVLVKPSSRSLFKTESKDQLYNYYRNNEFVADNIPLSRMVEVLNEAYGSHIVVEGEKLQKLTLNATFKNEPLDKILEVISETFHARMIKKDGKIILKER